MKIIFASDHAGYELKEYLKECVKSLGHDVEDMGAHAYDPDDDYPRIIRPAMEKVAKGGEYTRGIILGGSGQGEAIVANRIPGIRAVVYYGEPEESSAGSIISLSREHNDANVLSFGARFVSSEAATRAVHEWLQKSFSRDTRHERRIALIDQL
jgi:ribose 5-phosphate isomerase B